MPDHNLDTAPHKPFSQRIDAALADEPLRASFRDAMDFLTEKRRAVLPEVAAWEQWRDQAQAAKAEAVARLPELLEQLEAQCQANGIQVHWAEDAEQANQVVRHIAERHRVRTVVKGKSMLSEEIGLNAYLQHQGIECVETDMGEYIVQLAGETPSHIIMPAIHKTKADIARLFAERLPGVAYTEQVDALIGIGRQVLRERFEHADMGVSGVNFAVAETGTLCLVENEGNGRMSTHVPPVHVALMGIEKVIARMADLPNLLRVLTRSATGQAITTYVNLISGPRGPDEKDGPREVHLVLIDNGRSAIYQRQRLRDTLHCIRCGACMNHCPVYTRIGGHAYGSTYPGPIGQVVMPQLNTGEPFAALPSACSLNGACGDTCPVKIPLPDLIRELRQPETDANPGLARNRWEAMLWHLWAGLHTRPWLYRVASRLLGLNRHWLGHLLRPWMRVRSAPRPARRSLHQLMKQRTHDHD